jgi:hypothetical protein
MATLTNIPRELRDQILAYVIQSHQNERPALDQTFEELTQHRQVLESPELGSWCKTVLNIPESITANATNLLLVNHQLNIETSESIERLIARVLELDVIILDEILPLPTWLHVPTHHTNLDKVNVTFRISGRYDPLKEKPYRLSDYDASVYVYAKYGRYKGFRGGCGAGPAIHWQTYSILERFIKAGPVGEVGENHEHRHMTVKILVINIETPPDVDADLFQTSSHRYQTEHDFNGELSVLDPRYLAQDISNNMANLLGSVDPEWFSYGKILYEHVDTISVRLDGEELIALDVAERLRDVCEGHELEGYRKDIWNRYLSPEGLAEYRKRTWEKRKERGLKVLGN